MQSRIAKNEGIKIRNYEIKRITQIYIFLLITEDAQLKGLILNYTVTSSTAE